MAMASLGIWVAFALAVATFHCRTTWADFLVLVQRIRCYFRPTGTSAGGDSAKRVDEAMDWIREESYVVTARFAQHLNVACVIAVPLVYDRDFMTFAFMMFANSLLYSLHWLVSAGRSHVSVARLRCFYAVMYTVLVVAHWMGPQSYDAHSSAHMKCLEAAQLVSILVFADSRTHMVGQLVLALTEVCRHIVNRGWERAELAATIHAQLVFSVLLIIAAIVFELILRGRVAAQFQHADAESLVSSFRTLLGGISDAELLLNDELKIEASTGLSRILLSGNVWEGAAFGDLLSRDREEQLRFQAFMSRGVHDSQPTSPATAPCLRVSFCTAQQQRVGVDLYHVQVPHLYGCEGAYHLLALKMDLESPALPEAVPAQIPSVAVRTSTSHGLQSRASSRASSATEGSLLPGLPHLKELMLVVDPQQSHELLQVHMQYQEGGRRQDSTPEVSLRQFVRPTEWQTISSQVRQFASRARSGNTQKDDLGKVWVRMIDNPGKYMRACDAKMSFKDRGTGGHVWIHLRKFRSCGERSVGRPSELGDVEEHTEESSE
mmetsp:Transcript_19978/g.46879  ORF Transcript_19978/g.46879 Transcript_19978/m.46879 type:complete len:548 (-) Transcript_19978:82-1725(-)|eukprot:s2838_g2.t2